MAVRRFGKKKKKRGRKVGWRKTWGVDEVARWLESCDMVGPAAYFRSQGVGGLDLVTFSSEQHLARDLGLTPFVAAKVLKLRNQYLAVGVQAGASEKNNILVS